MADRAVVVELKVKLYMRVDEGVEVEDVINSLEYDFEDGTGDADVEDMTITDYEIVDSK